MEDLLSLNMETMAKSNSSKRSKISKFFLFMTIFLFLLLTFSFLSKEYLALNAHEKHLRKLDAKDVLFTIFQIFNYFFYFFFFVALFLAPSLYCVYGYCMQKEPDNEVDFKNIAFFVNKVVYIVIIGYLITSGVNFFNNVDYKYSLSIFICSFIYLFAYSIVYISFSVKCQEECCFPGICQWGYLPNMCVAPCCFFAPCKEEECRNLLKGKEPGIICCVSCVSCTCACLCISNAFIYYLGLLFYDLFWLLGKLCVLISCCDCWLKEEYDMDSFSFIKKSKTDSPSEKLNEVKDQVNKVLSKKEQKQLKKDFSKTFNKFKKALKKATESKNS